MAIRAKQIGARLKIQSQPNKGTSIVIELPRDEKSSNGTYSLSSSKLSAETAPKVPVG
jgi:signal transduction histidine kinase